MNKGEVKKKKEKMWRNGFLLGMHVLLLRRGHGEHIHSSKAKSKRSCVQSKVRKGRWGGEEE